MRVEGEVGGVHEWRVRKGVHEWRVKQGVWMRVEGEVGGVIKVQGSKYIWMKVGGEVGVTCMKVETETGVCGRKCGAR